MNNEKKFNKLAVKAGVFYVLTQLLVRGITFLTTPIYTRLVSTEQYGELRVYESWILIFVPLMSLGLYRGVERAKYDYPEKYDSYVSSSQILSYISICVFLLFFLFFYDKIESFLGLNKLLFCIMFLHIFGYTSTLYYQRREKQCLRYKSVMRVTVLTMLPATVFSILFLYWGNQYGNIAHLVEYRVLGYYVPQIIVGLILAVILVKQGKCLVNFEYWKYGLLYSLPLIPELLSIQIMNQSDKIMIQKMVGAEEAGVFALATTVSYIMWIIEESVWNAWLPWLYEKISRDDRQDVKKPWLVLATTFGIMTIMIVILTPEIILILGGSKYKEAMYLVAPMILGTLFRFFSYIYSSMQNYYKKTQYVALGTIAAMVVNVTLNYVCIIIWGYQAAAYTTAFSYFVLMIAQGILEKKVTGECIVSIKIMVAVSLAIAVVAVLSMALFNVIWIIRWSVVTILGIIMLVKIIPFIKWTIVKQVDTIS